MEARFTDAAKKIDGQWRHIIDHASMPPAAESRTMPVGRHDGRSVKSRFGTWT